MQSELASELLKQLQPALYIIGTLTVLVFTTFGGGILKLIIDAKKDRDSRIDLSLEGLKKAVIENTTSITKIETRFDLFMAKHDKDLNNIARKVKDHPTP